MGTMNLEIFTLKEDKALLIRCADENANITYPEGTNADNALKVFIETVRNYLSKKYQEQPYTLFKAENGRLELVVILNENNMEKVEKEFVNP